jgi:serine protease AprX
MSYPAIIREAVSVGAVYDENEGPFGYASGAVANSSGPDRITPFSQRLHVTAHESCRTDIFAPGAPVTSSGIESDNGESVQHGTSQATPVTAGVVLLMQQLYKRLTDRLPPVELLSGLLRRSGMVINDGDNEDDNVTNTGLDFIRLDAWAALDAVRRDLQQEILRQEGPLK